MLPNLAPVVRKWQRPVTLKIVTETTVDMDPVITVTDFAIKAMTQPASNEDLQGVEINWSLKYLRIHSLVEIVVNNYMEVDGVLYKMIRSQKWDNYGYWELIGEQTKAAL